MSAKNLDSKKRWRSVSVGFRASPQEAYHIDMLVKTSGLTKQEYILKRLMCEEIIIHPNSRILKILCQYLTELTEELKRVEHIGQEDDVLENITYLVELIAKIKN